jgi:hypothetical protein
MISAVTSTTAAKRAASAALVLASVVAFPSVARADGPAATPADALFREGRALLDSKRFDEACPKLAQSQKLDPGAGTLLALALCHEGQGKTATAWGELNEAAALGKRVGRNDLASAAQKRAQAMEPLLARVVVRVPRTDNVEYDVKRDGEPLPKSEWGSPVPVDPGEHRVDVSAEGKVARSYVVRLAGAGVVEIVVDKLEDARQAPVAAAPGQAPPVLVVPPSPEPAVDANRGGGQRVVGLVLVGVGVVGLGVGAYFGGRALSESAEGRRACPTTPCPAGPPNDANDRAKASFSLSIISLSSGVGALALGAVIYALAPSAEKRAGAKPPRATARIVPDASPTQMGLGLVGSF